MTQTASLIVPRLENHLHAHLDTPERAYELYFALFHGGWMLYQCLRTPTRFQSTNYKLNAFRASNGVLLGSKNSPVLVDADTLFLQGAYREFDMKPSLLFVGDEGTYLGIVSRFSTALDELAAALERSDFAQRITQTSAQVRTQHNPHDTTEE